MSRVLPSLPRHGRQLKYRVPIAAGAARAELALDQRVRQLGVADSRGIDRIEMVSVGVDDLWADDCSLEGLHVFCCRRRLQEHDKEVARVMLGCVGKWITADDHLPFDRAADEKINRQVKALFGFRFEQLFKLRARPSIALENKVAALQQRFCVGKPQRREKISQIGHRDLVASADIYPAQKCDLS